MKLEIHNKHTGLLNLKLNFDGKDKLSKNLDTVQILPGKNTIELSEAEYAQVEAPLKRWESVDRLVIKDVTNSKPEAPEESEAPEETGTGRRKKRRPIEG